MVAAVSRASKGSIDRATRWGNPVRRAWLKYGAATWRDYRWVHVPGSTGVDGVLEPLRVKQGFRAWFSVYHWLMRRHLSRSRYEPKRVEGNPAWRRAQHAA